MFSALYLLLHNLFNQESPEEKQKRINLGIEIQKQYYKMIEENPDVHCSSCNEFTPVECYVPQFLRKYGTGLHCINCGGNVETANNISKIAKKAMEANYE